MKYYLVQIFLFEYVYKPIPSTNIYDATVHQVLDRKIEHLRVRLVKAKKQTDAFEAVKQLVESSKVIVNPFMTRYEFDGVPNVVEYNIQVTVPIVFEEL